jgi:hypothetical protein
MYYMYIQHFGSQIIVLGHKIGHKLSYWATKLVTNYRIGSQKYRKIQEKHNKRLSDLVHAWKYAHG